MHTNAHAFLPSDPVSIKCAHCGAALISPEHSQYVDEHRVRHVWKCEPCNYSFEAVIVSRRQSDLLRASRDADVRLGGAETGELNR